VQNLRKRFTISGKRAGAAASSKGETNDRSVEKSRNAKNDLNRADRDELVAVPGIGPAAAESILKERGHRGDFKSMDELSDVTGIGAQTVQNLRKRFTISGKRAGAGKPASKGEVRKGSGANKTAETRNSKSDLNRADRDELVSVPGIGPAGAESLLKERGDRGGFKSLDELSDVTGIGAQAVQNLRERFSISRKGAGAAASASKGEAKAPETSPRTTQMAKRAVEIVAETTWRSADTAAEIAGWSADVAGDAGKRTIEAAEQTGNAGREAFERVGDKSREALRSAASPAIRGYDELSSQGTDEPNAMAASSRALFETMQEIHREWLRFAQVQFSENIEAGREFARCRSPKDLLELQMRYTRSWADRLLTEATKLAELSIRLASAGLQPLQARGGVAERARLDGASASNPRGSPMDLAEV
jgi:competence protein ComEA